MTINRAEDRKKVRQTMNELGYFHEGEKPDVNHDKLSNKFLSGDWDFVIGSIEVYQDRENKIYTTYERSIDEIEEKEDRENWNNQF